VAKRRRPKLAPSPHPWRAVVLAIDTAKVSGWAIYEASDRVLLSGAMDLLRDEPIDVPGGTGADYRDPEEVCEAVANIAATRGLDPFLVLEEPFRGNDQGGYKGCWRQAWARTGLPLKKSHGVYPATWRARVLGPQYAAASRDTVHPIEVRHAITRIDYQFAPPRITQDQAAAICIGHWAMFAGEVGKKLPRRAWPAELRRKAS